MLFEKDKTELQDEIIRLKEMDYFKYHSFLNGLNLLFEEQLDHLNSEEERAAAIDYTKKIIRTFSDIYGHKKLPEDLRKKLQEIIILKDWNFN